ncbi:MAG: diguanylate cyclase domain-containing protein [Actinomycetota bacterium]
MPVPAQAAGASDGAAGLRARPLTSFESPWGRLSDSWAERARRARALAILFAAGGSLVLLTLLLPHQRALAAEQVIRPVLLAFVLAAVLHLGAGRLRTWTVHLFLTAGTVLISAVVFFGSSAGSSIPYSILYAWVALYAFYFFTLEAAFAHLAIAGGLYASILQLSGGQAWLASLTITFGVVAVTGLMVGGLVNQVRRLAQTDVLTGLANRRTWDDAFERELLRAGRQNSPLSLIVLDLDGFKQINDEQGHLEGDQLLKEVSAAWHGCMRSTDVCARLGGDEFAMLLPDCRLDQSRLVVDRLRDSTRAAYSAGVTSWDGRESQSSLMARADEALYEAKRRGAGRAVFVSELGMPIFEAAGAAQPSVGPR